MPPSRKPTDSPPTISNAEWEVIKTLWDRGPMAARDVFAALPPDHGWAYKTVKTLLSRLVAKGAIGYEQIGNSYLYRPLFSREQCTSQALKGFIDRVLDGSLLPVVAHFIEERDLSEQEVARLRQLLAKQPGKPTSKPKRGKQ